MKYFFYISIVLFCLAVVFIFWAKHSSLKSGVVKQPIIKTKASSFNKNELKIMTWNLGFAYGVGSEGSGYEKLSLDEMNSRLSQASEVIAKHSPDIVLVQEIDFDSSRSHNINQLEFLAKKLKYPFYAYAVSWEKNYLPFPYFPIKNQWGKMKSGGAILSRFPIYQNTVELYELPSKNAFWYNWFYLYRYSQFVKIEVNGQKYNVVNNHLEAFNKQDRMIQAGSLSKKLVQFRKTGEKFLVVGGDLNTTPPNAKVKSRFIDEEKENYEHDETYSLLSKLEFLKEVVSLKDYAYNESTWFTFSSIKPDRRLDYLFIGEDFEVINTKIDKNQISDHFPVISTIKIKD